MLRLNRDTGIWTILVNSPESIEAIEFMVSLAREHQVVPPNVVEMDYPANVAAFAGGNISMLTTGPWGAQTFIGTNPEIEGKFAVAAPSDPERRHADPAPGLAHLRGRPHDRAPGRGVPLPASGSRTTASPTSRPTPSTDRPPRPRSRIRRSPRIRSSSVFLRAVADRGGRAIRGRAGRLEQAQGPVRSRVAGGADRRSKDVPTAMNTAATRFAEILGDRGELKYPACLSA